MAHEVFQALTQYKSLSVCKCCYYSITVYVIGVILDSIVALCTSNPLTFVASCFSDFGENERMR